MPRLSLFRPEKGNDFNFLDSVAREQYTVGGTDMNVYKYLGPKLADTTEISIQDMVLLENRDRRYETDTVPLRGVYNLQDLDFNLSQFGFFFTD